MDWRRLSLQPLSDLPSDVVDELCSELVTAGASGTSIEASGDISCFISGSDTDAAPFIAIATRRGFSIISNEVLADSNWNEQCAEVWQPVATGMLTVVPVESPNDQSPPDPHTIKIIPGQGFGTGHHPTTRMILETLSKHASILATQDLSIFDLGTGSGILAIAAAKLFNTPVEAVDNDPYAITNANDNVALNKLEHLVTASTTPIENLSTSYNLILANLYGEVLVQLAGEVTRLASPGCLAIMSGITELVRDSVVDAYTENHGWIVEEERSDGGWCCISMRRP
jgi:ribosomal protein L11 methyltransferase